MRATIILTAFVVLLAAECIRAQFPRRRKPSSDIYKWEVDIGSDNFVAQKAVSLRSKDGIFLFTYGKDLKEMNMTRSSMLMEYTDPAGVMAVKFGSRRKGICVLIPISETLDDIKNELITKNGTNITLSNIVAFNATGDPLSSEEANSVYQQHPVIRPFCFRAAIVEATSMTLGDEDADSKMVTMLGWNARVSLMFRGGPKPDNGSDTQEKKKPRFPKFPRRRGPIFPRRG